MELKFKCLILDHDDTAVDSSPMIHYPAHVEVMRLLRPHHTPIDLEGWFLKNFHPGIMEYLMHELEMNDQELDKEYQIWREFASSRAPNFFPGFIDALARYREKGGLIAVVSHSEKDIIKKHYGSFPPDVIFGWSYDKNRRKPSPWPVQEILRGCDLRPEEALIVDDLKPGVLMSQASGVPVAAAGWSHRIPEIEEYMRTHCVAYFEAVEDFKEFILKS